MVYKWQMSEPTPLHAQEDNFKKKNNLGKIKKTGNKVQMIVTLKTCLINMKNKTKKNKNSRIRRK